MKTLAILLTLAGLLATEGRSFGVEGTLADSYARVMELTP